MRLFEHRHNFPRLQLTIFMKLW